MRSSLFSLPCLLIALLDAPAPAATPPASHPPLRVPPQIADRPPGQGPGYYADPKRGDDRNDGAQATPWRTIRHALRQLKAGDTLYLRGGVYYECAYVALAGRKDAPVTIRSAPGEQAILDGAYREFAEDPASAWEPVAKEGAGEYRSKRTYPNLRDVIGSFGDSMVGLQTYYHAQDLRSTSELIDWEDWDRQDQTDIKPLYCGPGLWYDRDTGYIHTRLAHTRLPDPIVNYRGETDPRKLPLVIAPFNSMPLHVDGARHVRFQDLIVRGAGYTAVQLDLASDVEFDNVTVWCGTYGIRALGVERLRFLHSALYGSAAPWSFRSDTSKRDYPGRPHRNISRLNTHALLEIETGRESSVYATPQNDQWEFAHSEFTDGHDALYFGAINLRFHHNLVENMQDDGLYLSPMYLRHRLDKTDPELHIYQNVFRRILTTIAFGGPEKEAPDKVFLYRNIFDLRGKVQTSRPTTKRAQPTLAMGRVIGDHGSPPWSALNIYHNTFVLAGGARQADMGTFGGANAARPRRVFNNIFLHLDRLPAFAGPNAAENVVADGNLFDAPGLQDKIRTAFFQKYRASDQFTQSKKLYPPGSSTHSLVAEPRFKTANDFRLQEGSPAIGAGVELPEGWPDPARKAGKGNPDIGALPLGSDVLHVGR